MMVSGYERTELLYRSANTVVYRAHTGAAAEILRIPKDSDNTGQITRLRREQEILQALGKPCRLRLAEPGRFEVTALISSDCGGEPLRRVLRPEGIAHSTALWIAIALMEHLAELHNRRIVHKDINPDNVLVDIRARTVALLSFDIASRLPRETHKVVSPEILEGSLPYISPEQTGRMNRAIDYRSDFYSFGVILYEMLTGRLPFGATDPMELVHAHIAQKPVPPRMLCPGIPKVLSDIVMKLMAKTAEERYQSSHGILADLHQCLAELEHTGTISSVLIGHADHSDIFQIPQRLYGRDDELDLLMAAFERVSAGCGEVMLVSGYSGIGKTSLIHEVHKPIVEKRGFFISGKYDQYRRDIPYLGIVEALRELMRQILTESATSIARWRGAITEALGMNAPDIVTLIPEAQLVLSEQQPGSSHGPFGSSSPGPAMPDSADAGARPLKPAAGELFQAARLQPASRFHKLVGDFIRVFARPEHPLVLFLDDLQWADAASLRLLGQLMRAGDENISLLSVGAYRDNEVDPEHPLMHTIGELERSGVVVHRIALGQLDLPSTCQLVAETLSCTTEHAAPLAALLQEKTGGNPFFLIQFFTALYQEGYLHFDHAQQSWHWDLTKFRHKQSTLNVVELMLGKLQRLPQPTQNVLMRASCVGTEFDLHTLASVLQTSPAQALAALWVAVQEGLVLSQVGDVVTVAPDSSVPADRAAEISYRFLHDRVQQAAYSLIPADERKNVHLEMGRMLLASTPADQLDERVFDIVNHFGACIELVTDADERVRLAKLNLLAGQRARQAGAYEPAIKHLEVAASLLPEFAWGTVHDLTMQIHVLWAECLYLSGNTTDAEALFSRAMDQAASVLERAQIQTLLTTLHRYNDKYSESAATALSGLALLGVHLPDARQAEELAALEQEHLSTLDARLRGRNIAELIELPEMTVPTVLVTMSLLEALAAVSFFLSQRLVNAVTAKMIILTLEHGNCRPSATAYTTYGMHLGATRGEYRAGYAFAQLARDLSRKMGDIDAQLKSALMYGAFVSHWRKHVDDSLLAFEDVRELGARSGNLVWSNWAAFFTPAHRLIRGDNIDEILDALPHYIPLMDVASELAARSYRQVLLSLKGKTARPGDLSDSSFVESDYVADLRSAGQFLPLQHYYTIKLRTLYVFGRYSEALAIARESQAIGDIESILYGQLTVAEWVFYHSLVLVAALREHLIPQDDSETVVEVLIGYRKKLRIWADNCRENFLHKYLLVCAEMDSLAGDSERILDTYERAVASAEEHGFVPCAALAAERAAEYNQLNQRDIAARSYLLKAYALYGRWGATAKIKLLGAAHPELARSDASISTMTTGSSLDLTTVMKAAQTISGEIVLERLLQQMMRIIIENAGAEKGFFLFDRDGELEVNVLCEVGQDATVLRPVPVEQHTGLSVAVVKYVQRTRERVVIDDAAVEGRFRHDSYIRRHRPRSLLCAPIIKQRRLIGILYLENNLISGAFTPERLHILEVLSAQSATSLENAVLYDTLEQKVEQRTTELRDKNMALGQALEQLRRTQQQLVVQEKLASLGALTAGIAHEIRNPLNFINNFAELAAELADDLSALIDEQGHLTTEASELIDTIKQNVLRIRDHGRRADSIVNNMVMHSRGSSGAREPTELNALISESARLAYHGFRTKDRSFNTRFEESLDTTIGSVHIVASDMSRVLLNVINNACYALNQKRKQAPPGWEPLIRLSTRNLDHAVEIRIYDNGPGIPADQIRHIFHPFFTTKPAGEGTGLGLSISHEIVVQGHRGDVHVDTAEGEFTEFTIVLPR